MSISYKHPMTSLLRMLKSTPSKKPKANIQNTINSRSVLSDKLYDNFFTYVPGLAITIALLHRYDISLPQSINRSDGLLVIVGIFIPFIIGQFVEGITKVGEKCLLPKTLRERKERNYKINRKLYLEAGRVLPDYFSFRTSFYRNWILAGIIIALLWGGSVWMIWIGLTSSLLSIFLYSLNFDYEQSTLEDYAEDLYGKKDNA